MTKFSRDFLIILLFGGIILACAPFLGRPVIDPAKILDAQNSEYLVYWRIRLPRALAAFFAGAGLSLCGLIFQAIFRNPLATPYTLGVSSGAALGASVYFRLGASLSLIGAAGSLVASLLGCCLSMLLVYGLTLVKGGLSTAVMLLAGVIINFFFSSLVMFIQYASNAHDAMQIMRWLMGSLAAVEISATLTLATIVTAGFFILRRLATELDLLNIDEEIAASRGVDTYRVKLVFFFSTAIMVGAIVSATGPIGFVGMIIPHICRFWPGGSHAMLMPASFFMGGAFLVLCDLAARTLLFPVELPIGILTAMLGAPFFLWILFGYTQSNKLF